MNERDEISLRMDRSSRLANILDQPNHDRIGIIIGQLTMGGAEKQIVLLAEGLIRSTQFTPIIFCLSDCIHPFGRILSEKGIPWLYAPKNYKSLVSKTLWLLQKIRETNCSLLYGILNIGNIYASVTGKINKVPVICSVRSANASLPLWIRSLSGVSCNFADYVIVNSRSCARSLHDDLKVNHNRVGIINNGVGHINRDDENRARKRSEWQIPTDATVIGTVGNLKSEKNPLLFIRIFEELNKSSADEPLYFIWIGDGKERLVVEDYLRTFNTDMRKKILFPGERDDIIDILSAFDVFVLTSYYEGLPNALMEAMAAGLPCVATRVEGTIDVVGDTEEDILEWASPKDPMGFAKTVRGLIDDKKRCTLMGARARAFVQSTYSIEKMVDLHRKVFTDVLSKDLPGS